MWYTGRSNTGTDLGSAAIGYATSTNGINWTKRETNDGLIFSGTNTWEQRGVTTPYVIQDGSKFNMYYSGYSAAGGASINVGVGFAVSDDGITGFTRNPEPSMVKEQSGYAAGSVGSPSVYETAANELKMWFSGADASLNSTVGVSQTQKVQFSITAKLQGSSRPTPDGYTGIPITVKLFSPTVTLNTGNIMTEIPQLMYSTSTSGVEITDYDATQVQTITITADIPTGPYQMSIATNHALVNLKNVIIDTNTTTIDMGEFLEGDANNDGAVGGADLGGLIATYWATPTEGDWQNGIADFDENDIVNALDYSLIADNYFGESPIVIQ